MEKFQDLLSKIELMNALELSQLVKALEEKFGVSAAMPVMAAGAAGAGEAVVEEKTAWNVLLTSGGTQKIQVIKVIKEATGLGLQESKAIVDGAPKLVKGDLKKEEAEELKKKLETAGAVVELQ